MLRFDPATPLAVTPPFVRWTLVLACPLRELTDPCDPDATERLLRGVRCYSDALAENRVVGDTVLGRRNDSTAASALGFSAIAVLEPFGGERRVRESCQACPANALQRLEATPLAGCVGHLVLPANEEFHLRFDARVDATVGNDVFPITTPRWFGLWIDERPTRSQMQSQLQILTPLVAQCDVVGLADYASALSAAIDHGLALVVRAFPGGRCEGRRWIVDPHCSRCKAVWHEARRGHCRVCGGQGGRQPERTRRRMGTRPYRLLHEFLPPQRIEGLLEQWQGALHEKTPPAC